MVHLGIRTSRQAPAPQIRRRGYNLRTMSNSSVDAPDWSAIPAPADDGAARHLAGARIPSVPLPATDGTTVDLGLLPGLVVVYAYPRTGIPGIENPHGWDLIPGRGDVRRSHALFGLTLRS